MYHSKAMIFVVIVAERNLALELGWFHLYYMQYAVIMLHEFISIFFYAKYLPFIFLSFHWYIAHSIALFRLTVFWLNKCISFFLSRSILFGCCSIYSYYSLCNGFLTYKNRYDIAYCVKHLSSKHVLHRVLVNGSVFRLSFSFFEPHKWTFKLYWYTMNTTTTATTTEGNTYTIYKENGEDCEKRITKNDNDTNITANNKNHIAK